jgi:hypothetical protein
MGFDYEQVLNRERSSVRNRIDEARSLIDAKEDADYYRNVLAGGGVRPSDNNAKRFVDSVEEVIGADFETIFRGPVDVDYVTPEGFAISGRFDLQELTAAYFQTAPDWDGFNRTTVQVAIEDVEEWFADIDLAESPDFEQELKNARQTVSLLEPIKKQLESDDLAIQTEGLAAVAPAEVERLRQEEPPSVASPDVAAQQQAIRNVSIPRRRGRRARAGREATVLPTPSMLPEFGGSPELARARAARAAAVSPAAAVGPAGQPVPDGRVGAAGLNPAQAAAMGAADVAERVGDVTAGAKAMKAQEFSRLTAQGISPEEAFNLVFGPDAGTPSTTVPSSSAGGAPRLTAAQIAEANQAEVEALLASQFGGFSFFLQKNRIDMMVGLDANGMVVAADDPNAVSAKNVLDVIVEQGITAPTRVLGILQNTAWWKVTDAQMRQYDVSTANMSEPEKLEYLEPVLQLLEEEAQFLGVQLDASRARRLAENITRMGEQQDPEYIRGTLLAELEYDNTKQSLSEFGAARDQIKALSRSYFVPIDDAAAGVFAEDVYVGRKTTEQVEQYFREQASNRFPTLENAINAGVTPEQYFSPYKYEIERMLDRPNVDLYEEFADVIDFIPDTGVGAGTPRPMTLGEVRKYVRGLDEWQQSSQGKDSARSLAFAIGREFGEVA